MSTDEYSRKFYRENAKRYADHVRNPHDSPYHAFYEKPAMYALVPDIHGKTVLSLGCGSGEDSVHLKRAGAEKSVGIDITPELIDIARTSYPDCEFRVMDMEHLDFPQEYFDFAYSSLAIHYVEDWGNVFKGVYGLLKPGSHFLFSCGHPVRFAMDDFTLQMKKDGAGKPTFVGNYLATRKIIDALGKGTANTWTRPFGDISAMIAQAGFLIERIVEPKPLEELKEISPDTYERLRMLPEFVIFKLLKPNL